ncbi:MAG: hypothetical protein Q8Q07_06180, partial [Dehalococcoidales bacterium]|nr:hypothetical protein [Dehalococcoidales bacterium]
DNEEIARWLSIIALQYSDDERFAEMTGLPYSPGRSWSDLALYEEMIGQEVSPEIREKIEKPIEITPEIEKAIAKYKGKKGGKK